jgi:hypothetical protein
MWLVCEVQEVLRLQEIPTSDKGSKLARTIFKHFENVQ